MTDKPPSIGAKEHKMTLSLAFLKNSGRAAVTALVFGAAALVAMPAIAASGPSFSFGIQIPGSDVHMGVGQDHYHSHPVCLGDDEVASELEDAGWRHVQIGQDLGRGRVLAYGTWGHALYQMVVNRCTGSVHQVQRVNQDFQDYQDNGGMFPHRHDHNHDNNGGLGLQFNFGN